VQAHIDVDAVHWTAALGRLPSELQDVYFSPEFHEIQAANGDGVPHCSIIEEGASVLVVPGLRQAVDAGANASAGHWDLQTCRTGCAGPLTNAGHDRTFLERAWSVWTDQMARRGAVAALFRLHPLIGNERWLPGRARVSVDRSVVFVDLREGQQHAWDRSEPRHRNMVRKARRLGITVAWNEGHEEFVELYRASMDRLGADEAFRFGAGFFDRLWQSGRTDLAIVRHQGALSAAAVFFFGPRWAHYYLSARTPDAGNYTTNLLIDAAMHRAAERGLDGLYLGGGRSAATDDELLRFKRSTGGQLLPYRMGLVAIDDSAYDALIASWIDRAGVHPTWLLGYRQPHPAAAVGPETREP
jgi:UDP-N-acetylbacillosamine alanyltransferase